MDLATSGHELSGDHQHNIQQQGALPVSPVSPQRPAPSLSQMMPSQMAASNYHPTPPSLLHHHQHGGQQHGHQHHDVASGPKLKLASHAASGNGLGTALPSAKSGDHKSNDQVVTDQAREILRQAVVSGLTESNAAATKAAAVNAANVKKGVVRYRECQKNHAAGIGGHAIDGCGEFMPGGDDDALRCAACDCHRNFHRREVEGEVLCDCKRKPRPGAPIAAQPTALASTPGATLALTASGANQMTMAAAMSAGGPTDSDEQDDGPGNIVTSTGGMMMSMRSPSAIKKRFRTKFSTEQKDKMCAFAEKVGWRIQKHDEAAVQEFCAAVGVKRHVLKVWMHNNKHTMGKKP